MQTGGWMEGELHDKYRQMFSFIGKENLTANKKGPLF